MTLKLQLKLLTTLALGALSLPAAQIFSQNFESTALGTLPSQFSGSGTSVESTGTFPAGLGLGARHLRNTGSGAPSITLSLSGLAAHSSITVSFDLIVWDSMDAGKLFGVTLDGSTLIAPLDTSNYFNSDPSGFSGPGALISGNVIDFSTPNFGNNFNRDQARRITNLTLNHTASTLNLVFAYSGNPVQGGTDESWGIDNLVISDNNAGQTAGVPEPSTLALAGLALAAVAVKKYRQVR